VLLDDQTTALGLLGSDDGLVQTFVPCLLCGDLMPLAFQLRTQIR